MKRSALLAVLLTAFVVPRNARAQLPIPSLSLVAGTERFGHSVNGSNPYGAARLDIPLLNLVAEGSFGLTRDNQGAGNTTYMIPEAQLQYQLFPMIVRPYIGVGGGVIKSVSGPGSSGGAMASAAVGVRVSVPIVGFGFRAEARARGFGSGLGGHSTELTVGVSF